MTGVDRNWIVESFTVHRQSGTAGRLAEPGDEGAVELRGCMITDPARGVRYEMTVETSGGTTTLTSLTVLPMKPGERIDNHLLARVPAQRLAKACARYLARGRDALVPMPEPTTPGEKPPLDEVARAWRDNGGDRHLIADRYSVSPATVSAWLTQARKAGLIPRDSRRRGRKPSGYQEKGDSE